MPGRKGKQAGGGASYEITSHLRFNLRTTCAELVRNLTSQKGRNNVSLLVPLLALMLRATKLCEFQAAAYLPED